MTILTLNSKGADVEMLQRNLSVLGYKITIDGTFGRATVSAVIEFQKAQQLQAD